MKMSKILCTYHRKGMGLACHNIMKQLYVVMSPLPLFETLICQSLAWLTAIFIELANRACKPNLTVETNVF